MNRDQFRTGLLTIAAGVYFVSIGELIVDALRDKGRCTPQTITHVSGKPQYSTQACSSGGNFLAGSFVVDGIETKLTSDYRATCEQVVRADSLLNNSDIVQVTGCYNGSEFVATKITNGDSEVKFGR
ncbi:MAG: hypothetical protein ABIG95_05945 [Candidatus Woesearchaeota archaeon]